MTDEKGVGSLPDAGTIKPGDPGHIETHDEMARLMQVAADSLGIILDPPAPKPAVIGQYGHVDAHNTLLANIEQLAAAGGGGLPGGLEWGDFTTNGDETTSNTWGPDAQGRMWKWAEWNDADNGPYTVNLTGGQYWVLTVGGGDGGTNGSNSNLSQGQPGLVREGYWEFAANQSMPITVGRRGTNNDVSLLGMPSYVGDRLTGFSTQGKVVWGSYGTGRGAQNDGDRTGYVSSITGNSREYANGWENGNDARPGRAGYNGNEQQDGCVIIATAAPNAKALNWVHTTYHAEVTDGEVTAVYTQKHYADGTTTPLPTAELVDASYGVSEGWLFVDGELQPPPPPPEPTLEEIIAELQARIDELTKDKK